MTNENARSMLCGMIERFQTVTNESIGVVYSGRGGVSALGNEKFRTYVAQNKDEIWNNLAFENRTKQQLTIPERDLDMLALLDNILKLNVHVLRKIGSWATQRTIGMY